MDRRKLGRISGLLLQGRVCRVSFGRGSISSGHSNISRMGNVILNGASERLHHTAARIQPYPARPAGTVPEHKSLDFKMRSHCAVLLLASTGLMLLDNVVGKQHCHSAPECQLAVLIVEHGSAGHHSAERHVLCVHAEISSGIQYNLPNCLNTVIPGQSAQEALMSAARNLSVA